MNSKQPLKQNKLSATNQKQKPDLPHSSRQHQLPDLPPSTDPGLRRNLLIGFILLTVLVIAAVIIGYSFIFFPAQSTNQATPVANRPLPGPTATFTLEPDSAVYGESVPDDGAAIVPEGSPLNFKMYPPTSGAHYAKGAPHYGFYQDTVPEGNWLTNLHEGAVVILYQPDLPAETINQLKDLQNTFPPDQQNEVRLLILPYTQTPRQIVALAWDRKQEFNSLDYEGLLRFYRRYAGRVQTK